MGAEKEDGAVRSEFVVKNQCYVFLDQFMVLGEMLGKRICACSNYTHISCQLTDSLMGDCIMYHISTLQVDDDLQFLLENNSLLVEETVKKYSDQYSAAVIFWNSFFFHYYKA